MRDTCTKYDIQLLALIQQNDDKALALLMRRHYAELFRYGRNFTNDTVLLKDSLQEVFVRLWQTRHQANSIVSPKAYLLETTTQTITTHLCGENRKNSIGAVPRNSNYSTETASQTVDVTELKEGSHALPIPSMWVSDFAYVKYQHLLINDSVARWVNTVTQSIYQIMRRMVRNARL